MHLGLTRQAIENGLLDHYVHKFMISLRKIEEKRYGSLSNFAFRQGGDDDYYSAGTEAIHVHVLGLDIPTFTALVRTVIERRIGISTNFIM